MSSPWDNSSDSGRPRNPDASAAAKRELIVGVGSMALYAFTGGPMRLKQVPARLPRSVGIGRGTAQRRAASEQADPHRRRLCGRRRQRHHRARRRARIAPKASPPVIVENKPAPQSIIAANMSPSPPRRYTLFHGPKRAMTMKRRSTRNCPTRRSRISRRSR